MSDTFVCMKNNFSYGSKDHGSSINKNSKNSHFIKEQIELISFIIDPGISDSDPFDLKLFLDHFLKSIELELIFFFYIIHHILLSG